jgi:hypothetical protein
MIKSSDRSQFTVDGRAGFPFAFQKKKKGDHVRIAGILDLFIFLLSK